MIQSIFSIFLKLNIFLDLNTTLSDLQFYECLKYLIPTNDIFRHLELSN